MSNIQWENIKVESLGLFDLTLAVGVIGTGTPPTISITAMIHGDETSGLFAIYKFIEEHVPNFQFQGTIRFIPSANPLGAFASTRTSLLDGLDMNRVGAGDPTGEVTERLANALHELVKGSTLVINFHEFEANSPLTCVYTNCGSDKVRSQILKGMLAFAPDVIWSIPRPSPIELKPILSFDSAVANAGTPVFSIEFARRDLITPDMMNVCLSKLKNVLIEFGVIEDEGAPQDSANRTVVMQRTPIYTPTMGIWEPKVNLMSEVKAGQIIGTLNALPDFSKIPFQAPKDGFILQVRPMEVVRPNSIVFAIGVPDEQLQDELDILNEGRRLTRAST